MGLFSIFKSVEKVAFPWIELVSTEQLKEVIESSSKNLVLIFKHSTRCSISSMAKSRFENNWIKKEACDLYYLDLLMYRSISDEISELLEVKHHSPQVIVLLNKKVIYEATHSSIDAREIEKIIK